MSVNEITIPGERSIRDIEDENLLDDLLKENLIPDPDVIDAAIETALIAKNISPMGDKIANLNDEGRRELNNAGADLKTASKVLGSLMGSSDDKIALGAAKFVFERHAGKLDSAKEVSDHGIVINIGQQLINNNQGSIFNPDPVVRKQIA